MMNKLVVVVLALLSTTFIWGQNRVWPGYSLDSTISVAMPGEVIKSDTARNDRKTLQLSASHENSTYVVQRILIKGGSGSKDLPLPHDTESLLEMYEGIVGGMSRNLPYILETQMENEIDRYIGYEAAYVDSMKIPAYTAQLLILNNHLYTMMYGNEVDFDQEECENFFSSISIDDNEEISQFLGKSKGYRIGYSIGEYLPMALIIIVFLIFVYRKTRR